MQLSSLYTFFRILPPFPRLFLPDSPRCVTTTTTDASIQTEDLPAPHFVLHRPDLRARANFHDIFSDRTPLYHLRHIPLLQIPLRRLLYQRTLRARRRPRPRRALSSRARFFSSHRLAPRMHPRSPPTVLRQPRRPFRRQVLHSLGR